MATLRDDQHTSSSTDVELQDIGTSTSVAKPLLDHSSVQLKGWPTLPSNVKYSRLSMATDLGVDVVLLALASLFLAFALVVQHYDQASVSKYPETTKMLLDATRYGPTVFPILFACVLGRASHSVFVWRLERGERIGVLDILAGSASLTSAVISQLKLRMISIFGMCLVAIWALSPVGGQACLRQMSLGHSTTTNAASFTYMVQKKYLGRFDTTDRVSLYPALGAVFNAALLGPPETKASPRDAWGIVKIPKLESYEASGSVDDGGWYNAKDHDAVYTSLVGIPVAGIEDVGAIDYNTNIEARYFHLNCPEVCMDTDSSSGHDRPSYENFTGPGAQIFTWDDTRARNRSNVDDLKPLSFTYNDRGATGTSRCSLTTTYVEAKVSCATSKTCLVANIRRSRLDHSPAAYTLLDTPTGSWQNWYYFAEWFVKAMDGHNSLPTAVQGYLLDTDYPALTPSVLRFDIKPEEVPSDLYATRLGQLMNTYWECMQAIYAIPGGLNDKTAAMGDNLTDADKYGLAYTATSPGTKSTVEDVIVAHGVWSMALIIASTAMILASLVPPVIRHYLTRGPDVMLNVSSLATRDNPFVALPVSGSSMDATDRARLVKDQIVRFGDVIAEGDVGRLAIGTLNPSGVPCVEPVRRRRLCV